MSELEVVHTDSAPAAIGPYSQAISVDGWLYVSGQIPIVPDTGELLTGSVAEQTHQVMRNLSAILEVAGASLSRVVKATVYLSDMGDNELLRRETLFLEQGGLNYRKDDQRGLGRIRATDAGADEISSSWGTGVADLNLDGVLDLVVVNGGFPAGRVDNKVPDTTVTTSDPPAFFLGMEGGDDRWADVWPELGLDWKGAGRGLVLADLDGDLDTDVVISTRDEGLVVLRNEVEGPAVSIEVEAGCDATGVFVNVFPIGGEDESRSDC